jgi:starch-binding outer membrane protein, SusD/RagB family
MKHTHNYIKRFSMGILPVVMLGGMIIFAGCSKGFLNPDKQGAIPAVTLWQTQTDATNAVNAIYGNIRSWNNVGFAAIALESLGSDDAVKGSTASDASTLNQYDNFSITATEAQLDGFWSGQYQNINLCNQVLDSIVNINMDGNLKKRYFAEAKFVRAYSYFRLLRAFGNIPLLLHVPHTTAELNPGQTPKAAVYAAIEQDLTDAAGVLPASYGPTDVGRATKGAALALHAKVAMYQQKWSDVLNYTNQVMALGYTLFPNYYQLFRIANENNSESIFEIQANFVAGNSGLSNCQYSQPQGNKDAGAGWGFNVPTQNLVNEYEPGDPRLQATVMMAGTTTPSGDVVPLPSAGAPSMYNMKAYVPFVLAIATSQGADQNFRAIRYADVILMNAEANNELGNTAAALTSLEMVRARARANSANPATTLPPVTTTDQGTLRTAIWHERRVELAMENDRYFDVIRQGPARAAAVFAKLGWTARNTVWPIPQTELDISGGLLVQNAGY